MPFPVAEEEYIGAGLDKTALKMCKLLEEGDKRWGTFVKNINDRKSSKFIGLKLQAVEIFRDRMKANTDFADKVSMEISDD
jgi:hypothetical protein